MADTDVYAEFRDAVNMTAGELNKWLGTEESKTVGQRSSPGTESVGHHSGRKIVGILGKKETELTEADEQHMRKVVGYVHRHTAQRPDGDVADSRWRHSLMNWGHDPLKK
ncbi:DNA topoisomerase VI subunit B [Actinoplanes campanulatus]|uniref:DNA topoisomerase VI subunit B n=1 Tax=Actinoplanes campanulatus TaxID=113559 RepID=A0A7W5AC78_9ACTN|nr:DUF3140 domain-containing protein [Actinoplanes campanulatus]MBB3093617.1 DNA topoisomerase VI subunit B [Actinoplanes campanulatus]GGN04533.1 DNA-binding protein [Actinoplanes campanulatus]GID35308.1 DNA-binding protein [Actinoplanes campanulatus]